MATSSEMNKSNSRRSSSGMKKARRERHFAKLAAKKDRNVAQSSNFKYSSVLELMQASGNAPADKTRVTNRQSEAAKKARYHQKRPRSNEYDPWKMSPNETKAYLQERPMFIGLNDQDAIDRHAVAGIMNPNIFLE